MVTKSRALWASPVAGRTSSAAGRTSPAACRTSPAAKPVIDADIDAEIDDDMNEDNTQEDDEIDTEIDAEDDEFDVGDDAVDDEFATASPTIRALTSKFRSEAWKKYLPMIVDGKVSKGKCKHCDKTISAKRGAGTSALLKHLDRCKK